MQNGRLLGDENGKSKGSKEMNGGIGNEWGDREMNGSCNRGLNERSKMLNWNGGPIGEPRSSL